MKNTETELRNHLQDVIDTAQECFKEVIDSKPNAKDRLVFIKESYLPIIAGLAEILQKIKP